MGACKPFFAVCSGKSDNLSPPDIGLRMARPWAAIKASSAKMALWFGWKLNSLKRNSRDDQSIVRYCME